MNFAYGLAVYFVIWWTILFAVLPFGVKSQQEDGDRVEGTDPGAPIAPMMLKKAAVTSVLAGVIFAGFYAWMVYG